MSASRRERSPPRRVQWVSGAKGRKTHFTAWLFDLVKWFLSTIVRDCCYWSACYNSLPFVVPNVEQILHTAFLCAASSSALFFCLAPKGSNFVAGKSRKDNGTMRKWISRQTIESMWEQETKNHFNRSGVCCFSAVCWLRYESNGWSHYYILNRKWTEKVRG